MLIGSGIFRWLTPPTVLHCLNPSGRLQPARALSQASGTAAAVYILWQLASSRRLTRAPSTDYSSSSVLTPYGFSSRGKTEEKKSVNFDFLYAPLDRIEEREMLFNTTLKHSSICLPLGRRRQYLSNRCISPTNKASSIDRRWSTYTIKAVHCCYSCLVIIYAAYVLRALIQQALMLNSIPYSLFVCC